jgi:dihydrofolate reductase
VTDAEPILALMVAIAENGVIGRAGGLPWRLSSDMKHFRRTTMGKPVIMGRKTFASLKRPLDGRDNIVVTRDPHFAAPGVFVAHSLGEALDIGRDRARVLGADEIMVIGGARLYRECLPLARRIHLTRVHAAPNGDVRFPEIDLSLWRETRREQHPRGPKDDYAFTLSVLDRD